MGPIINYQKCHAVALLIITQLVTVINNIFFSHIVSTNFRIIYFILHFYIVECW